MAAGGAFPPTSESPLRRSARGSSVAIAVKELEGVGLLTWVHRLTKIRRREQDLFGHWGSAWQVIRTSNGYSFVDPLEREPGRRVWCKSENPTRPQNREKQKDGARLDGAQVMQEETSQSPPEQTERPLALRREHGSAGGALLSNAERAAIVARMDAGTATKPDWDRWLHDLEIRLGNV